MMNAVAIRRITAVSAARAKKLWEPLLKILTLSPADDSISPASDVSVSIDKGVLSVVYGSRILSRMRIKRFRTYPVEDGYPTPEGLASSVTMAMDYLGVGKKDITLAVPKAWAIVKTAEFPLTVKDNISDVVSYEMDRLTPFTSAEAYYDFRILNEESGRLTISIVAVRTDLINPYMDALSEKGYAVSRVTLNLSAMGSLCRYIDKSTDFIFIKMDAKGYEGAMFTNGIIAGAFAGDSQEDERAYLDTIIKEVGPLSARAKKQGRSPRIIISLKGASSAFREMLKARLESPLRILDESDIKLGVSSKEIPYEAVGSSLESLRPKTRGLNLLSRGYEEKEKPPVVFTIILLAALIVMWLAYIFAPVRIEEKRLQEIGRQVSMRKAEVRKIESLKKDIEALESEVSTINNFKWKRPTALSLLKEFTSIIPKTAWLTRVKITDATAEVEGYANSATELLPKLEASKYFKKAEFSSPTFRDVRMNSDRFSIKMEIEGVKKEEEAKIGKK